MKLSAVLIDRSDVPQSADLDALHRATLEKVRTLADDVRVLGAKPLGEVPALDVKTSREFLDFVASEWSDRGVLILNACSPLLDLASTRRMIDEQEKLVFDYTYPENLPDGLVPEILDGGAAAFIAKTVPAEMPLFRSSVREIFESDISSYDANIFIHPSRIVNYRVNFTAASYNDYLVTKAILDRFGADQTIESLDKLIRENPALIRRRPTYFEIQLSTERESGEMFLGGRSKREGHMKAADLRKILRDASDFAWKPVVLFGFYGEPFLNPNLPEILAVLKEFPGLRFIFESRGLAQDYKTVQSFLDLGNVEVLFDLSFASEAGFAKHKKPLNPMIPALPLTDVESRIRALTPAGKVYIQFTRSTVNEEEIMDFYRKWKDYQDRIVIKKLDTFGGKLKKLVPVDLAPVERSFCMHLKHDVPVLTDGTVPKSRADFDGRESQGSVLANGLETCWENIGKLYEKQWADGFAKPEASCDCDDWWVFNF